MKYRVNLFPPKKQNIVDNVIYFSFNYLRYILVFTQLVVICVFFFRFRIDQDIVDLKDSLNQKQEIVLVSDPLLKEAATTQNKITNINEIIKNQQQLEGMMDYFLSTFPDKLKLTKLDLDETQINFEGLTDDPNVVKAYYNNLKKEGKFGTTQLLKLNKTQDGFSFNFVLGNYKMSKAS